MKRQATQQGRRVTTLAGLHALAQQRRSVFVPLSPAFANPKPAAVIINLQGHVLLQLFTKGMYEYKKQEHRLWQKGGDA